MIARALVALVIALLLGCRSGERPAPPLANAAPVFAVTACPRHNFTVLQWIHELFPGCAAMPLLDGGLDDRPATCADCPRPCRVTTDFGVERVSYDAAGRWSESRDDKVVESCRYEGDKAATCASDTDTYIAHRDAKGRLAGIEHAGVVTVDVTYDARGDVSRIGVNQDGATYTYDSAHRLVGETDVLRGSTYDSTYRYADGRLVEAQSPSTRTSYHYDEAGRLASAATEGAEIHNLLTYEYDARGRIVREHEEIAGASGGITRTFEYECPQK